MSSSEVFKLIQPDLLTYEELFSILTERGVESGLLLDQTKEDLVSLYNRVALPLPQRKFRQNYRGSLIMAKTKEREKILIGEDPVEKNKSFTIGVSKPGTSSKSNSSETHAARLKPPPDMINHEKRKIRLNSTSTSTKIKLKTSSTSSDLDKIVIKKRKTSESSCNEVNPNVQVDNESGSSSLKSPTNEVSEEKNTNLPPDKGCNGTKIESSKKRVLLKRNHLLSKSTSEESSKTLDSSRQEPEKKRKPITWP